VEKGKGGAPPLQFTAEAERRRKALTENQAALSAQRRALFSHCRRPGVNACNAATDARTLHFGASIPQRVLARCFVIQHREL
jgi:hypothetical protein